MTPMLVQCSSCLTEFELDPNKVPAAGVRARCSVCSAVITVPAPPVHAPVQAAPASGAAPATSPAAPPTPSVPPAWGAPPVAEVTPPEAPVPQEAHHAPPAWGRPAAPIAPVAASLAQSGWAAPKAPSPSTAPSPAEAPSSASSESEGTQRQSINPFLTRDPALRAKRLARALVSDIVAYHPARHAEGLRDGTLKTLFRDEIKKSYEEYVDQVGRDFAGSTTHFQDALNDVLASGKKLF